MSLVVLTIGYQQFLLPDDKGVSTAVKVLSRGVPCRYHPYASGVTVESAEDEPRRIEVAYLPKGTKVQGAVEMKPARARRPRLLAHESNPLREID